MDYTELAEQYTTRLWHVAPADLVELYAKLRRCYYFLGLARQVKQNDDGNYDYANYVEAE